MRRASRIVEYATRDQAQNAVNTLSNQNLMGRLVYVREVSEKAEAPIAPFGFPWMLIFGRTARLNPDSLVPLVVVEASEAVCKAVMLATVDSGVEALAARSILPTFVSPLIRREILGVLSKH